MPHNAAESPWRRDIGKLPGKPRSGIISALQNIRARMKAARLRRESIRELSALDNRLLRDVGIEPSQIKQFVDEMERSRRDGDIPPVLRQIRFR